MFLNLNVNAIIDEGDFARELAESPAYAVNFFEALVTQHPADVSAEMSKELVAKLHEFVLAMEDEIANR